MKKIIIASFAIALSTAAFADTKVILTGISGGEKGNSALALDIISDVNYKGFQFDIDVAGATSLDLSACTSGLSKSLTISCKKIAGDKVRILVVDLNGLNVEIPAGKMQVGTIKYAGSPSLAVSNVEFADKAGEVLESSVTADVTGSK
jgi:hypothetical protein